MSSTKPLPSSATPGPLRPIRWLRSYLPDVAAFVGALATAALAALLLGSLHGCGGGVGGEGTGSFAQGPVAGFGSIVVNGVRYEDNQATVLDDDGASYDRSALGLGSVVQVQAGGVTQASDGTASAVASRVQLSRSLVGPVSSINLASAQLVVLGQTVRVSANTVFGDGLRGGLSSLAVGQVVEVHGPFDASTVRYQASRVALAASNSPWRVRGPVSRLDTAAKTFSIGAQSYSYAQLSSTASLSNGAVVQVLVPVRSAPDSAGRWQVTAERLAAPAPKNGESTEIKGVVASLTTPTRFSVDGITVDASLAKLSGNLSLGALVEVKGSMNNGVLLATSISVEDDDQERDFEVRGTITFLDAANRRLVVRNTPVSYARSGLVFEKGSAADLAVGKSIRAKGVLSADRTGLEAQVIRFDD